MITINPITRQFTIPGADLVFGVTADSGSEVKYFQCPRYVGNKLDVASSFVRINYRNGNGETDSYLVNDVAVDGENVTFSWELAPRVTAYKGHVKFVMCVVGPDLKVKWHTTLGNGQIHEGLEPDHSHVEDETADVVAQLIAMVEAQTAAVENTGAEQVAKVKAAAEVAEAASVAEIEAKGVNTRNSIPADYTALSEAVDTLTRNTAPGIVCEAEGSVISLNDASGQPLRGLRIFGKSTQDGVPSPENPVEIVSVESPVVTVAGRNLCPESSFDTMFSNGATNTYDATTHTITMTEDATGNPGRYIQPYKKMVVGEAYTVSFDIRGTNGKKVHCGWDKNRVLIALTSDFVRYSATVIATNTKEPVAFYSIATSSGGLGAGEYMQFANVQIEAGTAANEYKPYVEIQTLPTTRTLPGIPATSGGNYADSKGQQRICDEVDFARGVYVQRCGVVTLDGSDDEYWVANPNYKGVYYPNSYTTVAGSRVLCDTYGMSRNGKLSDFYDADAEDKVIATGTKINFKNIKYSTLDEWLANLMSNPLTIAYVLATPIETPLSEAEIAAYRALHTNKPNTTILNDSGAHMAVEYTADTKLYIDNKIKELTAE